MARIAYRIAPEAALALVQMEGPTNVDDCLEASRRLHGNPRWDERYDVIWDLRCITDLNLVPGNIETIVEEKRNREAVERLGKDVLVVSGVVERAIAVLIRLLARRKNQDTAVCSKVDEALHTLGYDDLPQEMSN